jgi:hypothetical protein
MRGVLLMDGWCSIARDGCPLFAPSAGTLRSPQRTRAAAQLPQRLQAKEVAPALSWAARTAPATPLWPSTA